MTSRGLTAGMLTEVDASALSPILLLKAEFDSGDVRLWSGYGDITFNSETYQGQGDWVAMSAVQEDGGIAARNASFKLMGQNAALLSIALSEPYQGRQITSWLGAFDEDTQAIIADPVKVFSGQMDVMEIVSFILDEKEYGLRIDFVKEVIRFRKITRVPGDPSFIKGVINLRGNIVPVMDLRLKLLGHETETEEIEIMMTRARSSNPNTRLHLRADRTVRHEMVKKVIQASSRGGVNQVIFSTYVTEK